jgi:hypothetical protein
VAVRSGGGESTQPGGGSSQSGGASTKKAAREYKAATDKLASALEKYSERLREDAESGNTEAIKSDASGLRDVYYEFDGEVRKIKVPPELQADLNRVLEGDRTIIGDLDAFAAATSDSERGGCSTVSRRTCPSRPRLSWR